MTNTERTPIADAAQASFEDRTSLPIGCDTRSVTEGRTYIIWNLVRELEIKLAAANAELAEIKRQAGDATEFVLAQINADLRAQIAQMDKAIDEINVGVNAGNAVIWIESISGFYMSAREAIEAAIKEQDK